MHLTNLATDLEAELPAWLNAALQDAQLFPPEDAQPAPPTIADYIAQLGQPQSHGDRMAVALLEVQARRISSLEARIAQAPEYSELRYLLEGDRRCEQQIAESIGMVALAYRNLA